MRITTLLLICILSGCTSLSNADKIDPAGNLTRQDYIALRERGQPRTKVSKNDKNAAKDANAADNNDVPPPPDISSTLIPPVKPKPAVKAQPLISLDVNEKTPVREVLLEVARKTGTSIALDPRIEGGVVFAAHEKPADEVLVNIAELAGLRIRESNGFLRVELDEPFARSWTVSYPNLVRRANSSTSISTNVFDSEVGGNNSSSSSNDSNNNSTTRVEENAEANFWLEVDKSLTALLAADYPTNSLTARPDSKPIKATFTIDRQGGLITVNGTSRQHAMVDAWVEKLRQRITAQVLIEARIVEVELNDGFQSGINWRTLFKDSINAAARFGTVGAGAPFVSATTAADGLFTTSVTKGDFNSILSLVRQFGTTRVLSSPRLTVMNNQNAVLKVAHNEVYFITTAQFPTVLSTSGVPVSGTPVFSSTPRTVPVGFVMTVQPAINTESSLVTLTLRPTISRIVRYVEDPSIGLNAGEARVERPVESKVPILAVREMDSVLQVGSGEVAVMGGLMEDASESEEKGIPPFDTMPVVGNLAKSRDTNSRTSELVILLRATILNSPYPDAADKSLYNGYMRDPRPIIPRDKG